MNFVNDSLDAQHVDFGKYKDVKLLGLIRPTISARKQVKLLTSFQTILRS